MIADNEQVLLCNKITAHRFYEMLPIESLIRCIGAEHSNVYSITLFACCRQKYEVKDFAKNFAKDSKEYQDFSAMGQDKDVLDKWIKDFKFTPLEYNHYAIEEQKFIKLALNNSESGKSIKRRSEPYIPQKNMSNVIFCWGCKPSKVVNADTRMVHDFNDTLQARYDKRTLCLTFPEILDNMLGAKDDCNWEFW